MSRIRINVKDRYGMDMTRCAFCKEEIPKDESRKCAQCDERGCPECVQTHVC